MIVKPEHHPDYLGDGVYAAFDGCHVWISLYEPCLDRSDEQTCAIALEPEVIEALLRYARNRGICVA